MHGRIKNRPGTQHFVRGRVRSAFFAGDCPIGGNPTILTVRLMDTRDAGLAIRAPAAPHFSTTATKRREEKVYPAPGQSPSTIRPRNIIHRYKVYSWDPLQIGHDLNGCGRQNNNHDRWKHQKRHGKNHLDRGLMRFLFRTLTALHAHRHLTESPSCVRRARCGKRDRCAPQQGSGARRGIRHTC